MKQTLDPSGKWKHACVTAVRPRRRDSERTNSNRIMTTANEQKKAYTESESERMRKWVRKVASDGNLKKTR